jgi:hypothetical protein
MAMTAEQTNETTIGAQTMSQEKKKRQRSRISFPYQDLDKAIAIAKTIYRNVGLGSCRKEQLATWLNFSSKSSGLRYLTSTAVTFGLIYADREDILLTAVGRMVVDAHLEREGRAKSFLIVPLFRAVFDKYKGGLIPPTEVLESELVALGVARNLKSVARNVFERSAEQAGFYTIERDRLEMPTIRGDRVAMQSAAIGLHPLIEVLLQVLPEAGSEWSESARSKWLQALSKSFDSIYRNGTR